MYWDEHIFICVSVAEEDYYVHTNVTRRRLSYARVCLGNDRFENASRRRNENDL